MKAELEEPPGARLAPPVTKARARKATSAALAAEQAELDGEMERLVGRDRALEEAAWERLYIAKQQAEDELKAAQANLERIQLRNAAADELMPIQPLASRFGREAAEQEAWFDTKQAALVAARCEADREAAPR